MTASKSLSENALVVLACVRDHQGLSLSQIVAELHADPNNVSAPSELDKRKLVRRDAGDYQDAVGYSRPESFVSAYYPNY